MEALPETLQGPSHFRRKSGHPSARHMLHLRFTALVPKSARGVFSDTAAGIAAVSKIAETLRISGG